MLRILVVGLVLLVAAMLFLPRPTPPIPAPEVATVLTEPPPLPDVALTDSRGEPFGLDDLRGHWSLLFFGFTHCPDICPLTLQVLAQASDALVSAPRVVFVSVDSYRDSPERIGAYLDNFAPSFIGVTGSDEALSPWVKALGVTVHKNEQDGEPYNVTHNGTVYVINPDAALEAVFGGSSHRADVIVQDFARIRARAGAARTP